MLKYILKRHVLEWLLGCSLASPVLACLSLEPLRAAQRVAVSTPTCKPGPRTLWVLERRVSSRAYLEALGLLVWICSCVSPSSLFSFVTVSCDAARRLLVFFIFCFLSFLWSSFFAEMLNSTSQQYYIT